MHNAKTIIQALTSQLHLFLKTRNMQYFPTHTIQNAAPETIFLDFCFDHDGPSFAPFHWTPVYVAAKHEKLVFIFKRSRVYPCGFLFATIMSVPTFSHSMMPISITLSDFKTKPFVLAPTLAPLLLGKFPINVCKITSMLFKYSVKTLLCCDAYVKPDPD